MLEGWKEEQENLKIGKIREKNYIDNKHNYNTVTYYH